MSKKDYIAIAAAIKEQIDCLKSLKTEAGCNAYTAVCRTARNLAQLFVDSNPRFDRVRFLRACGINS